MRTAGLPSFTSRGNNDTSKSLNNDPARRRDKSILPGLINGGINEQVECRTLPKPRSDQKKAKSSRGKKGQKQTAALATGSKLKKLPQGLVSFILPEREGVAGC